MALLQKVLTIIARILLGICTVVGVACLVYTLSTAAVQAGFDSARSAVTDMVDQARASLESGVTSAIAGVTPASGSREPAAEAASDGGTSDYAAAYQQWKDAVSSPVGRVFAGTGIDAETLEGAAGGSASAFSALTGLDETALATVDQNAGNLAATAGAHAVPASLPEGAQAQLAQADAHCASFCADVRKLLDSVRTLRGGNVLASTGVTSAAYAARSELEGMDACMQEAERILGI